MKTIIIILICFLFTQSINSQSGWFWQKPLPQGNDLSNLFLLTHSIGYCMNYDNILKTTNNGDTWEVTYTGFNANNSAFCMLGENEGYIILDSSILIKTKDGCKTWEYVSQIPPVYSPLLKFFGRDLAVILSKEKYLNSTKGSRIMISTNSGTNWKTVFSDTAIELKDLKFYDEHTGYAAGYKSNNQHMKFYKTSNGGERWDSVQNNITAPIQCMYFNDSYSGFIGGGDKTYKTTNGGINWNLIANVYGVKQIYFSYNLSLGYINAGDRFYSTTNGGLNWTGSYIVFGTNTNYVNDIKVTYYNFTNKIYIGVGTGGIIVKSTDEGLNWTKLNEKHGLRFWDILFDNVNTGFITADSGIIFKTTDGGINWIKRQAAPQFELGAIGKGNVNTWYFSEWGGKILKTTNTGLSFDTQYTNSYGITRLKFINENTGFGVCKYNFFLKTTNGGVNWKQTSPFSAQNWALDFINESTGFVGGAGIYKTTDGGDTWETTTGFGDPVDIQFVNNQTGYFGCSYGAALWKTTNTGVNWVKYNIPDYNLDDICFLNEREGFAACRGNIYKTTNGGVNWFNIRICASYVKNFSFPDSLTGYAISEFGAIIKTTNGGNSIGLTDPILPNIFYLYQNYPNPFNPSTRIKFEVKGSAITEIRHVKLIVYDITGRQVSILAYGDYPPGIYEIEYNFTNISSGIYFCMMTAEGFKQTRKIVLIK